ncbi:hypothetical protein OIU85_012154 [Salix viminalis]|uniref:Uncharacterized protein n=1 Tax=Salix viminalis TaxID=40686 RepID=A0A9Q0NNP6_SALVM|nr:hypothetical protein OIU85_012154 [Salix viminalis]
MELDLTIKVPSDIIPFFLLIFFLLTLRSSPTLFLMFESLLCDFLSWLMVVLLFLWQLVWVNDGMIVLFFVILFAEGVANKMVFSLLLQSIEDSLPHLLRSKPIPLLFFSWGL